MKKPIHDSEEKPVASRTQVKHEMQALQKLGEALCTLKPSILATLPLSEGLRRAIHEYHRIKANEAKRRQRQYIGRLMRDEDCQAIEDALQAPPGPKKILSGTSEKSERQRELVSAWCSTLIQGDNSVYDQLDQLGIDFNRQKLGQLTRQAIKTLRDTDENGQPTQDSIQSMAHLRTWMLALVQNNNIDPADANE